jgi:hypothetical protein
MEEIKTTVKDIENSIDDLRSHTFANDDEYMNSLFQRLDLVKAVNHQYNLLRKNIKNYKETREIITESLKLHDPSIADTRTTDFTSSATQRKTQ